MDKSIDIVIVSNALNNRVWWMTQNAANKARDNAGMNVGQVAIAEQSLYAQAYKRAETLYYDFPFNYNRCLNMGRSICKSQYIAFCNNDLVFEDKWAKNCVRAMEQEGFMSASPTNRNVFKGVRQGYTIGKYILGWCIVVDVKIFDYIGKFDEPVEFWYSDNVYGHQIRKAGIRHILVGNSQVRHLKSVTLRKIDHRQRAEYMRKQQKKFNDYVIADTKKQT